MTTKSRLRMLALLVAVAGMPCVAAAQATLPATTQSAEAPEGRFLRFVGGAADGGRLETADVIYRNADGVSIRLVSAVHIGEEQYFQSIQRDVQKCDAVLYEMVKPKDSGPPQKGVHSDSAVSKLQRFLKDQLNLSFQLDQIDYTPANFIHADLDAETFQEMQDARGESFATLFLSALLRSLSDPSTMQSLQDDPVDVVDLMTRPDGEGQIKLLLARHLGEIEEQALGLDLLNGTVILTERNKAVIKALNDALKSGKRDIAIFYGAAHMTDLSQQIEKMGFKQASTHWRAAWDVKIRPNAPSAFQKAMLQIGQQLLQPEAAQ